MNYNQLNSADWMDQADQKIRANWRFLTIIRYLGIPLFAFFCMGLLSLKFDFPKDEFTVSASEVFISLVAFLIIYRCAYQKYGTAFLTFTLVIAPLGMILSFQELKNFTAAWSYYLTGADLVLFIWWYVLCVQLRQVNVRMRLKVIRSSESFLHAINVLQQAVTLEELHSKFGSLLREKDDGNLAHEESIVEAYKQIKKNF